MNLVDADTGQVVELEQLPVVVELRGRVEAMKQSLLIEVDEKRRLNQRLSTLTGERNKKRELDPFKADADEAWAIYTETVKAAKEFDEKRYKNYVDRRKGGMAQEEALKAIAGAEAVKAGRCEFKPRSASSYCEWRRIFSSEEVVDRFKDHADEAEREDAAPAEQKVISAAGIRPVADGDRALSLAYVGHAPTPIERAYATLALEYGTERLASNSDRSGQLDWLLGPCPLHPKLHSTHLRVQTARSGGRLDFTCMDGCSPSAIDEALRQVEAEQAARYIEAPELRKLALFMAALGGRFEAEMAAGQMVDQAREERARERKLKVVA